MKKIIIFIYILFSLSNRIDAQTYVSGVITNDTNWTINNSPYIVTGNVLVSFGITLTIDPGVMVKFDDLQSIHIDGTLIARGTISNNITFTSNTTSTPGTWGYIYFSNSSIDAVYDFISGNYLNGCILEYCVIQYAGGLNVSNNGAVRLNVAYPFINQCKIMNNNGAGINAYNYIENREGNLKITNSLISNNNYLSGVYVENAHSVLINDNDITNNFNPSGAGGGIFMSNCDNTVINNNIISNNTAFAGGGIAAGNSGSLSYILIKNNIITNNIVSGGGGGAINAGFSSILIEGNYLLSNSNDGNGSLYLGGVQGSVNNNIISDNISSGVGGGIYLDGSTANLFNNQIVRNTANDQAGLYAGTYYNNNIAYNIFTKNKCTDTTNFNKIIYLWNLSSPSITNNNIFNNVCDFDIFNGNVQGSQNIQAINNWWGSINSSTIQNKIYDWIDSAAFGLVMYNPYLSDPDKLSPVSPPNNVIKSNLNSSQIEIKWNHNPENDIKGYHLYYGGFNDSGFNNIVDVGNDTLYILEGFSIYDTIAVTAYDSTYNVDNENQITIINDNMINGNESWFTYAEVECDSILTSMTANICSNELPYFWQDTIFDIGSTSGDYIFQRQTYFGCDSFVLLHLNIQANYLFIDSDTICENQLPYLWQNQLLSQSGTYIDSLVSLTGCDSIYILNLFINPLIHNYFQFDICQGNSFSGNGFEIPIDSNQIAGEFIYNTHSISQITNCDSISTLILNINPKPEMSISGDTILNNGESTNLTVSGAEFYEWNTGETTSMITVSPNLTTYYYAIGSNNFGCTDTIGTNVVVLNKISSNSILNINISPNPADDFINIQNFSDNSNINNIELLNIWGQRVLIYNNQSNNKIIRINTTQFSNGTYFIRLHFDNSIVTRKIILYKN